MNYDLIGDVVFVLVYVISSWVCATYYYRKVVTKGCLTLGDLLWMPLFSLSPIVNFCVVWYIYIMTDTFANIFDIKIWRRK